MLFHEEHSYYLHCCYSGAAVPQRDSDTLLTASSADCIILMVPDDHFPPLWHGSAEADLTSIEKGQGDSRGQIGSTPGLWKVSITVRREDGVEAGGLLGGELTAGKPSWDTGADGIKEGEMDGSLMCPDVLPDDGERGLIGVPRVLGSEGRK